MSINETDVAAHVGTATNLTDTAITDTAASKSTYRLSTTQHLAAAETDSRSNRQQQRQ